jgi:hypothetical protein
MKQLSRLILAMGMALTLPALGAQHMMQERAYGYELMSPQERDDYQARMRATKTEQEREQIRIEHHKQMQERAKAQGKTLPDMPPAGGPGGGKGMGPGGKAY